MSPWGLEYGQVNCPYCKKGIITYLFKPQLTVRRVVRSAIAKAMSWKKSKAVYIFQTDKCPECGKTIEEIEKKLREDGVI